MRAPQQTKGALLGAAVDIWHADASGVYSKGLAAFRSIYLGWYPGRTVHIHVTVHLGGNVVHTGQLYFPDALTDAAYKAAPYSSRPGRSTRNASDSVFRNGGKRSLLIVRRSGAGYLATMTMGVRCA